MNRHALIHTEHFRNNLAIIRRISAPARLCLAVKADAYGHGAVALAREAELAGVEYLGVATFDEAVELREAGLGLPLLVYGVLGRHDAPEAAERGVESFVVSRRHAEALVGALGPGPGPVLRVHVKVDTGMGRLGCTPAEARDLAPWVARQPRLALGGMATHFPNAEDDRDFTEGQIRAFTGLVEDLRRAGLDPGLVHAANSAGLEQYPECHLDMVRPGLMAYGYPPRTGIAALEGLKPVMEVMTVLTQVKRVTAGTSISYGRRWTAPRDTWIGTVSMGYADGLPRLASGKLRFVIEGRAWPQVGTICMDQCMVDLGPHNPPAEGSPVTVFGPDPRGMDAQDIAGVVGTIPYEILCGISARVRRIYRP